MEAPVPCRDWGQYPIARNCSGCIRHLVALTTVPAIREHGPQPMANCVAEALLPILGTEYVYVAPRGPNDILVIEVSMTGLSAQSISATFAPIPANSTRTNWVIAHPMGEGELRICASAIGG